MKPNFETMNKAELKTYVLEHRDDLEAIRYLFRIPPGVEVKRYPPVCTEEGVPIEENIRIMEEAIQERIARENH
jgi:CBS domain-containing protein